MKSLKYFVNWPLSSTAVIYIVQRSCIRLKNKSSKQSFTRIKKYIQSTYRVFTRGIHAL